MGRRREQLVIQHLSLAAVIAAGLAKKMPGHVDRRDVLQDARVGLLQAASHYDASRGVEFGAYARRRIQGAVLDGQRREDHLSRGERHKVKQRAWKSTPEVCFDIDYFSKPAPEQLASAADGPKVSASESQARHLVSRALDSLKPCDAAVLRGYFLRGHPLREVAERLGISESGAWLRKERGLAELRRYFAMRNLRLGDFVG
jgi:RNA polymerase sigma factor (sigma-70 family)